MLQINRVYIHDKNVRNIRIPPPAAPSPFVSSSSCSSCSFFSGEARFPLIIISLASALYSSGRNCAKMRNHSCKFTEGQKKQYFQYIWTMDDALPIIYLQCCHCSRSSTALIRCPASDRIPSGILLRNPRVASNNSFSLSKKIQKRSNDRLENV